MSKYTKEQIAQADSMDLVSYLESQGYELMRQGSQYRLKEHDSLYVKGNQWYWHSQHKGGKTLDFLIDYEGMSFLDAMKALIGEDGKTERRLPIVAPLEHPDPKELKLPEPAENNNAVYAYLKSRGIDARIIKECIDQGLLYQTNMFWVQNESGEFEKKACPPQAVFVGKDMDGTPRYACTRSCTGQAKHDAYGSDKAFAFAVPDGDSKALWVFESACDLLAHVTFILNYILEKGLWHQMPHLKREEKWLIHWVFWGSPPCTNVYREMMSYKANPTVLQIKNSILRTMPSKMAFLSVFTIRMMDTQGETSRDLGFKSC